METVDRRNHSCPTTVSLPIQCQIVYVCVCFLSLLSQFLYDASLHCKVENEAEVDDYFAHLNDYDNSEEEYNDID